MATYATVLEVRGYAADLVTYADEEIERELLKAERDIDWHAGFGGTINETSGLRFDPLTGLIPRLAAAVKRATCAQVQYRLYMGPSFFVDEVQYPEVQGKDQTTARAQRVGPQARSEFPSGLRKLTGRYA